MPGQTPDTSRRSCCRDDKLGKEPVTTSSSVAPATRSKRPSCSRRTRSTVAPRSSRARDIGGHALKDKYLERIRAVTADDVQARRARVLLRPAQEHRRPAPAPVRLPQALTDHETNPGVRRHPRPSRALVPATPSLGAACPPRGLANGIVCSSRRSGRAARCRPRLHAGGGGARPTGQGRAGEPHGATMTRGTATAPDPSWTRRSIVAARSEAGASRDGSRSPSRCSRRTRSRPRYAQEVGPHARLSETEVKRRRARSRPRSKRSEEIGDGGGARARAARVRRHPYARRSRARFESVGKLTRDDVVAFHREGLRPDTTIVAVGRRGDGGRGAASDSAPPRGWSRRQPRGPRSRTCVDAGPQERKITGISRRRRS